MTDIFHETKRERKYYEGKKQKALRYIDHTIDLFQVFVKTRQSPEQIRRMKQKLIVIRKMVNDI